MSQSLKRYIWDNLITFTAEFTTPFKNAQDWQERLQHACLNGYIRLAHLAIKKGAVGQDWLMVSACFNGYRDIVELMIENGASDWGWGLERACYGGHMDLVLLMIEKGASRWDHGLSNACDGGHKELALLLVEKGADMSEWRHVELEDEDIEHLIKVGITKFGRYDPVADEVRREMLIKKDRLSEVIILVLANIVSGY